MTEAAQVAILVVDDLPANLLAFRTLLQPLGHRVVTAGSGPEALQQAADRDFAVILLDVMMPHMDGLATLRWLRTIPRAQKTPVIFLTAYHPERRLMEQAYALGALDFIEKPVVIELLRAKVSAFVRLSQQSAEIHRQAEDLRSKDRHIGVLAHDLRTPLAAIVASAHHIQRGGTNTAEASARILRSASRMEHLIADLLQYARAAERHFVIRAAPMDLSVVCHEAVDDARTVFPEVTFTDDVPDGATGTWDRARIEQAIANLLSNAAKYGTGWVSISLIRQDQRVCVTVANGGALIPEDQLARLFEPFVRGSDRRAGVGLGLHVVREIAQGHQGSVRAESDSTSTRFTLELPLVAQGTLGVHGAERT